MFELVVHDHDGGDLHAWDEPNVDAIPSRRDLVEKFHVIFDRPTVFAKIHRQLHRSVACRENLQQVPLSSSSLAL
jgi:hypothetical protein